MQGVGCADVLLYFKCPTTKQMRCPVNAYKKSKLFRREGHHIVYLCRIGKEHHQAVDTERVSGRSRHVLKGAQELLRHRVTDLPAKRRIFRSSSNRNRCSGGSVSSVKALQSSKPPM